MSAVNEHNSSSGGRSESDVADAAAAGPGRGDEGPNAAERGLGDIDFRWYVATTFVLCAVRCVLLHPLYIVVTRKQACSASGNLSFRELVRQMAANEGGYVRSLSQGLVVVVLGMSFSETAHNAIYEYTRYQLEHKSAGAWWYPSWLLGDAGMSVGGAAVGAAWTADWCSRAIYCPASVVGMRQMMFHSHTTKEQRAQHQHGAVAAAAAPAVDQVRLENTKLRHVVPQLWKQGGGIRAFYAGFPLIVLVGGVTGSIFFYTYVNLKKFFYGVATPFLEHVERRATATGLNSGESSSVLRYVPAWCYNSKDNFFLNSAASVTGSCLAAVILNPYYVVLTRRQSGVAASVSEAVRGVFRQQGLRGFYRGAVTSSTMTIVDALLASTTYEISMSWAQRSKQAASA